MDLEFNYTNRVIHPININLSTVLPQVVIKGQFLGLGAFYMPQ
ncbi:MAG: hypothetical protein NTY48_07060 [Candidatus Diapherotrites archaeon]|nr:hypothetical protein [Candidatus Diapherotrites archaeon]